MTQSTNGQYERNLTVSIAVLGLLLLAGIGSWAGPARLILAICAGLMALGSIAVTLTAMGAPRPDRMGGNEMFIALLAVATLGTSTVMVHLDGYGLFGSTGPGTPQGMPMAGMPMMGPKTFIAGPSAAAQRSAQNPATSEPPASASAEAAADPEVDAAVNKIQQLVSQANEQLKAGDREGAAPALEEALVLFDKLPHPNMKRRGPIAFALARTQLGLGKTDEAVRALDAHLAKIEPLLADPSGGGENEDNVLLTDAAALLEESGIYLGNAGRFAETLPRFQKSIALKEKSGAPAGDIASTLSKLAISHGRMSNRPAALQALQKAKKLLEKGSPTDQEGLKNLQGIAREYGLNL